MSSWIDQLPLDDDLQLDLLVDNELNDDQRTQLLTFLEQNPERWRAAALRFVEAQLLTTGMERWSAETRSSSARRGTAGKPSTVRDHRWFLTLAVCAAFGCGLAVNAWWSSVPGPAIPPVVSSDSPRTSQEPLPAESAVPVNGAPSKTPAASETQRGKAGRAMRVPLRLVQTPDGQETWKSGRRLTKSRARALRQSGMDLERRMATVRVPLGNSRQVMIPAEQMRVVPRVRYRI